jgi:microcystin-dependent protein
MKNILFILLLIFTQSLWAVCTAPISRTPAGANSVLTSTRYNLELNTVYNRTNNLPGDCIVDESINGSKLIDGTVGATKLATDSVTTVKIADGAITAAKLAAAIENLVPVGVILPFGGTVAPPGYLLGNGQSISRATYANLFAVYGTSFGSADGVSFNNIDCRGRFFRFVDGGVGRDPDRASRTASATGGNVGDNIGSLQSDALKSHTHSVAVNNSYRTWGTGSSASNEAWYGTTSTSVGATGGNETRPLNINVNCIVKY